MLVRILAAGMVLAAGMMPTGEVHAQYYGNTTDCSSSGYNYQRCDVPWRDARLVRQLSDTQCMRGRNWGFDRRGFIWVDRGCSGRFAEAGGGGGGYYPPPGPGPTPPPWQPGPGWDQRFTIRCESNDGQNHFCQVDVGGRGRVRLERQESHSPCYEGQSWGWNRAGVWVTQGCRGVFSIDRRW